MKAGKEALSKRSIIVQGHETVKKKMNDQRLESLDIGYSLLDIGYSRRGNKVTIHSYSACYDQMRNS